MRALHGFAIAALAAAWPVSPVRPAAQGSAVLTGLVYDSTGFGALESVKVSLVAGGASTFTDSTGRYRLGGLGLGQAQVRFEHPRLNLMLGEVVADVELKSDSTEFNLLVSSKMASHGTMCGTDSVRGAPAAGFFGTVWLGGLDTILTGAEVAATWADAANNQRRGVVARADQFGGYRLCGIPAGVKALVAARGAGRESRAEELVLEPGEMVTWDFIVGEATAAATTGGTSISGRVLAQGTGEPIVDAEVVLLQSGKKAVTDQSGAFTLTTTETGKTMTMVRRIGFRPLYRDIMIREGQAVQMNYTLEPSGVRLPTISVDAPPPTTGRLREFEERRAMGGGTFFGPAELARLQGRTLDGLVRAAPGMIVGRGANGALIALNSRSGKRCPYSIWLDGQVIYSADGVASGTRGSATAVPPDLRTIIDIVSLKAVEIYDGPSQTPQAFARLGSNCGVIALWTK